MTGQNSNTYQETFYIIPRHIRHLEGMTLSFLDFYETIYQFLNKGKSCFLSNAIIKQRTGIQSDSRINMAFQFFEKHGVMKRVYKEGKRFIVPIFCDVEMDAGVSLQREGGISTERGGVSLERDINKEVLNKEINIKENTNYVSTKENENDPVFCAVQECLENTKTNLPVNTGSVKKTEYKETNYPVKKEQAVTILMAINTLGLTKEFLNDFIKERKAHGASISERGLKASYKELIKLKEKGYNLDDCLDAYANSSYKGFFADWIERTLKTKKNPYDFYSSDDTSWGEKMKNNPFYNGLLD